MALDDEEPLIICGEIKEPVGGLALEADSGAVVEPVLRPRSERL